MTDISVTTTSFQVEDRSWMLSQWGQGPGENPNCVLDVSTFTAGTHYPNGYFPSGIPLGKITAASTAEKLVVGPYAGRANEVQTINLGAATAGTITIGFDGETTAAIAFNATAAAVQTALEALSNINAGDVTVTGGPLPGTVTLTFGGRYAGVNVAQVVVTPTGLTGGTVTVTTVTEGGSAVTDGRSTCIGFLHSATKVPDTADTTKDVGGALVVAGFIKEARLPLAIDAAGKADLKLCHFG